MALSLVSSIHAVLRRRDPRAALFWVLVSFIFPFGGPFLYFFFGINRIERKALKLRKNLPRPTQPPIPFYSRKDDKNGVSPTLRHLAAFCRLVDQVVGMPLTAGNQIKPLMNGDQAYPAMIEAIRQAKTSIGMSTYIFNHDGAGKMFIEAFVEAAKRGVQIRVLIDDVGSGLTWSSVHSALQAQGIPVAYFNPSFAPWRFSYVNLRNHRKILTVDGRTAFTGGMNIHESHMLNSNPRTAAQDIHFKLEGPVVAQVQQAFREDWFFTTEEDLTGPLWFPELKEVGTMQARGISDGPDEDLGKLRWAHFERREPRSKIHQDCDALLYTGSGDHNGP